MKKLETKNDYILFEPSNYIDNPITLAHIKAGIIQEELAKRIKVTQAYISKRSLQGAKRIAGARNQKRRRY